MTNVGGQIEAKFYALFLSFVFFSVDGHILSLMFDEFTRIITYDVRSMPDQE